MIVSISEKEIKPKVYTEGFADKAVSLEEIAELANRYAV